MRKVLIAIAIASATMALMFICNAKSAIHEILAFIVATNATISIAAIAVVDQIKEKR